MIRLLDNKSHFQQLMRWWLRKGETGWSVPSRHSEDRPQRLKLFLAEGRAREDLTNTLVYTDALSTYTALKENYRQYIINKKEEGSARSSIR